MRHHRQTWLDCLTRRTTSEVRFHSGGIVHLCTYVDPDKDTVSNFYKQIENRVPFNGTALDTKHLDQGVD